MAILEFYHTTKFALEEYPAYTDGWMEHEAVGQPSGLYGVPYETPWKVNLVGVNIWMASGTDMIAELYQGPSRTSPPNPANALVTVSGDGFFEISGLLIDANKKLGVYYKAGTDPLPCVPQVELFFEKYVTIPAP